MKKATIILAAIPLLLLCSCNKESRFYAGAELSFSPCVGSQTVRAIIQDNSFPEDEVFEASAYMMNSTSGVISFEGKQTYFENEQIKKINGVWQFVSGERYYWPMSGSLFVICNYPTTEYLSGRNICKSHSVRESDGAFLLNGYTIQHTDGEGNPIEAENSRNGGNLSNASVDLMAAPVIISDVNKRTSDSVSALFVHELAQIAFTAKAAKDFSRLIEIDGLTYRNDVEITIDGISLTNIYSKGNFSHVAPNWPSSDLSNAYNYYPLRKDEGMGTPLAFGEGVPGSRTPLSTDILGEDGQPLCLLLIPQTLLSNSQLVVSYSVTQKTVRVETPEFVMSNQTQTDHKTFDLSKISARWQQNMRLVYNINFSLDEISVDVDYQDWKSVQTENPMI